MRFANLHRLSTSLAGVLELAGGKEVLDCILAIRALHALASPVANDAMALPSAGGDGIFHPSHLTFAARQTFWS
jgi:hypothetical protein